MDVRNREALLHQVMDNLVARVRQWKDSSHGFHAYQDLCAAHKDDIYRVFRDSGLQPWEFHTMLHRASEYGLVEDMKGLWSEVATTFLQMRSGYATDTPQHHRPAPGSKNSSTTGAYGAWPINGRSSNGGYAKPPGLEANDRSGAATPPGVRQQQQQYGVPPPPPVAAGPVSPADDTGGSSSDQHSSRKQQQPTAKSKSSKGGNQHAAAANGAAPAGQQQQRQQQRPGCGSSTGNGTKPASADMLPNGYISAWRNSMASSQAPALGQRTRNSAGFQAAAHIAGSTGVEQQQQQVGAAGQRSNVGGSPAAGGVRQGATAAAAAGGWELQEPLDLLPSGLLDDVYDQGDEVVDAPPSYAALANGCGSSGAVNRDSGRGSAGAAAAPGGRGKQQQQGKQQRQQKQQQPQQPPPQQQQQSIQQQQAQSQQAASTAGKDQLLQQQSVTQQQQSSQPASRAPLLDSSAMNGVGPVLGGPFSSLPGPELTSPLGMMQHHQRPAFESMTPQFQQQQEQQQQFMMLQQQARMYQQQFAGVGAWGATGHVGYVNPFAGLPLQPPPPPRSAAPAVPAAAHLSCAPPSRAAAAAPAPAGPAQQAPAKPGYAAVAAAAPAAPSMQTSNSYKSSHDEKVVQHTTGEDAAAHAALSSSSSRDLPLYQPPVHQSLQELQQQHVVSGSAHVGLSLFQTAAYDSPITPALAAGPLSPYPSPLHRSLSASAGASPVLAAIGGGSSSSSITGGGLGGSGNMAPMLLPPSAVTLGVIGEPLHSSNGSGNHSGQASSQQEQQQQQGALLAGRQPVQSWSSFGPAAAVGSPATDPVVAPPQPQLSAAVAVPSMAAAAAATTDPQQQEQNLQLAASSLASVSVLPADGSTSSAASSVIAPTATSVATTPHSQAGSPAGSSSVPGPAMARQMSATVASPTAAAAADAAARQPPPPPPPPPPPRSSSTADQQLQVAPGGSSPRMMQQQQPPAPPAKPLTWAQKLLHAQTSSNNSSSAAAGAAAGTAPAAVHTTGATHHTPGPRIAPAPKAEVVQQSSSASANAASGKQRAGTTGQTLLAVAKQQEAEAEAAAAAAVPTYSESAALDGLDAVTAKAAVSAASRMPLPAKVIQAWRSGLCLASLIKLLQSQRPDLAMALNDRIKGWLTQDCDRVTAECLVLFVLVNLRRDWHLTAKSPGAFLMGLLQHRAALISGSGMARKLLDTARSFPNVAVYIDSDVLQELGDMEPNLRSFIMDEYMCKQRHDWPEGLKFPSQCLLSCMRSIRYADPAVHKAYAQLMETRPDLGKAMNGVILYGLCKCDSSTGLAAVKRLSELPEEWTSAARVNASAFLYQKVQELCGGHCY